MAIIVLSSHQAFNPGADLWIVPEIETSKITQRLDWYNNFILSRLLKKNSLKISTSLKNLLTEIEFPEFKLSDVFPGSYEDAPLLISSSEQLPNRWVAYVACKLDEKKWIEKILKLYLDLNKPSMRIFLPTNLSMNQFIETWRSISSEENFSIIVEN